MEVRNDHQLAPMAITHHDSIFEHLGHGRMYSESIYGDGPFHWGHISVSLNIYIKLPLLF